MSPTVLNRILLVLAFVGLYVAGFLSLAHLLGSSIPCGATHGCDTVASHPSSYLFGKDYLAVAYLGFIGYLILAVLAAVRAIRGVENTRNLVMVGFAGSIGGTLYSLFLIYTSLYVIQAFCLWCLASAATMLLTLIFYALLGQALENPDRVPKTPKAADFSEAPEPPPARRFSQFDVIAVFALFLVAAGALGKAGIDLHNRSLTSPAFTRQLQQELEAHPEYVLTPVDGHYYGSPQAQITIVEFADLVCPACKQAYPMVKELVDGSHGHIRQLYRHCPLSMLPDHKMALPAAMMAEMAAEKGRYYEFVAKMYEHSHEELQLPDATYSVATSLGLDKDTIESRSKDPKDPAVQRVVRDINMAGHLGILSTPTFIILAPGVRPRPVMAGELQDVLAGSEYKKFLTGGPSG